MEHIGGGETLETLRIIIEAQTRSYRQEMDRVRTVTQQATSQVERQTQKMSSAWGKVGTAVKIALGVVSVRAIFNFGKSCVKLGSDLAEVQNVVDVTFGSMSKQVDAFAKNAIGQFGLSESVAKKYAGIYGSMSRSFGFSEKQSYEMSTAITGLTGDVASFYNISTDQASTRLKAIWTGETESLKELGVVMTQNALDQYALANGYEKTTSKMTEAEKVMLRYKFVQEQLSNAQGDFQRTGGGWANQVRVLQLRFDSLKATIGQGLINALLPVIKVLNSIIERLQVAAESFKVFTEALFGKNVESTGGAGSTPQTDNPDLGNNLADSTGDAAGNTGDIADNLADSAKQAQKIERALMSFDEINKISDTGTVSSANDIPNSLVTNPIGDLSKVGVLSDVNKELDKTKEKAIVAAEKVKEMLESLAEKAKPATDALKKLWDEGLSKLGNFAWGTLKDFWNNFLKPLGGWVLGKGLPRFFEITNNMLKLINWDKLQEGLSKVFKALEPFAEGVGEGLLDFYEVLSTIGVLVMDGIALAIDALGTALNKVDPLTLKELGKDLGILAGALVTLSTLTKIMGKLKGFLTALTGFSFTGIASLDLAGIINGLATFGVLNLSSPAFQKLGNDIWDAISDILEGSLPTWAFDLLSKIGAGIAIGASGGSWFPGGALVGAILGGITGAFESMAPGAFQSIMDGVFNFDMAKNLFDQMIINFELAFSGEGGFVEIGMNIVEGILNGIGAGVAFIVEPIGDFFKYIWDEFCKVFQTHSPSKAMEPLGTNIVLGILEGFKNGFNNFLSFIVDIPNKIKNGIGDLFSLGKGIIGNFAEGFKSIHIPLPHINIGWNEHSIGGLNFKTPSFNGIEWYAKGGFPETGQMFMANEAGPEMVGRMGNRNVVANNNQIIDGIKSGVYEAVVSAFSSVSGEGKEVTVNVYLEGDAKTLFRVVRKEGLNYTNSTGTPVFPT